MMMVDGRWLMEGNLRGAPIRLRIGHEPSTIDHRPSSSQPICVHRRSSAVSNADRCPSRGGLGGGVDDLVGWKGELGGGGDADGEDGAAAEIALDADLAAVVGDDAVADGEAEARALLLGLRRVERLEDPLDVLGRDAAARVAEA